MSIRVQVTFDCIDPARVAAFWAEALGYQQQDPPGGFASWEAFLTSIGVPEANWNDANAIVDPEHIGPRLFFQRVDQPKTLKNRVHLDLNVSHRPGTAEHRSRALVHAEADRLIGLGATRVAEFDENGEFWIVMQDIEGNEFCLQ